MNANNLTDDDRRELARKLSVHGTMRVRQHATAGWCVWASGAPIVEGIETEAKAWLILSGLCMRRAAMKDVT